MENREQINQRIVELAQQFVSENKKFGMYEAIADIILEEFKFDMSGEKVRGVCRVYRDANNLDANFLPIENTVVYGSNVTKKEFDAATGTMKSEAQIELPKGVELTPELLLEAHEFDIHKFELVRYQSSKWNAQKKGGEIVDMYATKIAVKPRTSHYWDESEIIKLFESAYKQMQNAQGFEEFKTYEYPSIEDSDSVLVLPIMDLHANLQSFKESSGVDYNFMDSKNVFLRTVLDVLHRTDRQTFKKIYFTIGSDMLNADNKAGTTTKGTPQVNDVEVERVVTELSDLIVYVIELIKKRAPVEVIHIPSNHDYHLSFGIANAIRMVYAKDPNVEVDYHWIDRKYKKFGNVLMGFAHNIKQDKVNDIVTRDARDLLADTNHTIYFLGHLHHENTKDVATTDVRRLPTVSAPSRWAYENGYGAVQKSSAFIVQEHYGITDVIYTFVE